MNSHYKLEKKIIIRMAYLILNISRMKKKQPHLRNISNDPKVSHEKFDYVTFHEKKGKIPLKTLFLKLGGKLIYVLLRMRGRRKDIN